MRPGIPGSRAGDCLSALPVVRASLHTSMLATYMMSGKQGSLCWLIVGCAYWQAALAQLRRIFVDEQEVVDGASA